MSEYSHIDKGKYGDELTNHFLGSDSKTRSIRVDGKPTKFYTMSMRTYYASDEEEQDAIVMSMVTNLDTGKKVDELDDFLS